MNDTRSCARLTLRMIETAATRQAAPDAGAVQALTSAGVPHHRYAHALRMHL